MDNQTRRIGRTLSVGLGLWLAAMAAAAGRLEAQKGRPLSAAGSQTLAFGLILPGIATVIPRTDALRSGQFSITGAKNCQVQVVFTLPGSLTLGGRTVSLQFSAGDGGVSQQNTIGSATAFDPRVPLVTTLSAQGRLYLFLGGTAQPGAQQAAGAYAANVTITVTYTGAPC